MNKQQGDALGRLTTILSEAIDQVNERLAEKRGMSHEDLEVLVVHLVGCAMLIVKIVAMEWTEQ